MSSDDLTKLLNAHEKQALESLKAVVKGFLANKRAEIYERLIEATLQSFKIMGYRMPLKLHMLHSHLDQFKDDMGAYSDEQREPFHQDVMNFERFYQGQYKENMMGDYMLGLIRDSPHKT